ncbi:MAG: LysR family transcriptional regulator [Oscillospiraceae bacterium]|nr:LysR family transcriptional regulator [Oscillospiraceae bacterium]
MTFQQLKYLLEIYHTGSISKASENLFLAQSSLSTAIANLEEELGCKIFTRSKTGMSPTAEGLQIIERASKIYGEYQLMIQQPKSTVRRVRFSGCSTPPTKSAYIRLLKENADNKDVTFSISKCTLSESLARVALGETDVAVVLCHEPRILALDTSVRSKKLQYTILGKTPVMVNIGPGHRLYHKEIIGYKELEQDRLVDTTKGTQLYNEFLKGYIHLDPEQALLVDNDHLRSAMIREGFGFSIGYTVTEEYAQLFGYRQIPLDDLNFLITVITNPAQPIPSEGLRYIELLKEEIAASDFCTVL